VVGLRVSALLDSTFAITTLRMMGSSKSPRQIGLPLQDLEPFEQS